MASLMSKNDWLGHIVNVSRKTINKQPSSLADMFYRQVLSEAGSILGNQTSFSLRRLISPLMSDNVSF